MSTQPTDGDRIAKVLARAGVASRREAERMIEAGRVSVNGKIIDSPALNVTGKDRIAVDGKPLSAPEPARLWLSHKPAGLVTTARDEQGRPTIFDDLPEEMPRVMSVGRLDLNSEGLLLLTNDGAIKRRLELPSTGWLRRYRVRINGRPSEADLEPLRKGLTVGEDKFQPMIVGIDRQQGANAWLTVGLREGKNREIRRAMEAVGFTVNRLIRVSYGPFQLGNLKTGEVEEVRRRVMRDQLGLEGEDEADSPPATGRAKPRLQRGVKPGGRPGAAPGATPGQRTEGRPGPKSGTRAGTTSAAPVEDKAGGRPMRKFSSKSGARPGQISEGKPGGKPGGKPNRGSDSKPGGKPGTRSGPRSGPSSGPRSGPGAQGGRPGKPRRG
ncbi:MAG: pseudouridine synthase [Pseudodonghicola sp.]